MLVSMPHVGTFIPRSVGRHLRLCAQRPNRLALPRLYDGLEELAPTCAAGQLFALRVDLNARRRANLYPARTPALCPSTPSTAALYREREPDDGEIAARLESAWLPYHRRLRSELERIRAEHGVALLWDAHSIASEVPRLFAGRLADFNFGTAGGTSCDPELARLLQATAARHGEFSSVLDGRFKGGYITRAYGAPARGVHAVQLEMSERIYMDERSPFAFRADLAQRVRPVLRELLQAALAWARTTQSYR